jgi:hypothetical protein
MLDSRSEGRDAVPALGALLFVKNPLMVRGEQVVPLGGVVNAFTVGGNEGGFHSACTTAEAGFNSGEPLMSLGRSQGEGAQNRSRSGRAGHRYRTTLP